MCQLWALHVVTKRLFFTFISNKSDDVINSGMLSKRQVNNFVSDNFVIHYSLDALSYFISDTVYKVRICL